MSVRQELIEQLQGLSEDQLRQVADYLAFLKYRSRPRPISQSDEDQIAALYAEFAEEDRELAEQGMVDYNEALIREDAQ